jgi:hypothetical protein
VSELDFVLSFESERWRARGRGIDVEHPELSGLEAAIAARLAQEAPLDVRLSFDITALPHWLHQYHSHYCNYTLRVPRQGSRP